MNEVKLFNNSILNNDVFMSFAIKVKHTMIYDIQTNISAQKNLFQNGGHKITFFGRFLTNSEWPFFLVIFIGIL